MTPTKIQEALKGKKKINQKVIAEELGVAEMTVSKVIHRIIVSDRIIKAIASKISMPHVRVFPEYYLQPPKRSTSKVACG
jgi:transcriptional regulator with XRE-family HTH domain